MRGSPDPGRGATVSGNLWLIMTGAVIVLVVLCVLLLLLFKDS